VGALFAALCADAQLISNPQQIPDTGKPPVVFLNGYQAGCNDKGSFAGTFGSADQVLQRDGRVSVFFNNCDVPGNPEIEELGNAFRDYLNALRFADGREVSQVDVVMHSMGGIILRCYLTGKQRERGVFLPPATVKVRKAVFLATPFFGSLAANLSAPDVQSRQLLPGSTLLFDLATWNQGRDDLRGIDAVAVAAAGGSGVLNGRPGFDDSTVTLTSGSLDFVQTGRTRVVAGYCHTVLTGLLAVACQNPGTAIARINDDAHPSARVILSFLNGTDEWKSIGVAPAEANWLKDHAGVQIQFRDAQDAIIVPVRSSTSGLNVRSDEIVWTDFTSAPVEAFPATVDLPTGSATVRVNRLDPGFTRTVIALTGGPAIAAVIPNFSDVSPRAVAPGSFISVYGTGLATDTAAAVAVPYPTSLGGAEVALGGQTIGLQYASATQINAVVPDDASGLKRLEVRTPAGKRGVNLLIEASVPSLFPTPVNAVSGALITADAPARRGDYISLYGTGLGLTERRGDGLDWARIQPSVAVGGKPCAVTFAGRAPGFIGLDQINCQIAADAELSDTAQAAVQSGSRTAVITFPIR
jgi:uncharacterized protein (TIGR03437 family)